VAVAQLILKNEVSLFLGSIFIHFSTDLFFDKLGVTGKGKAP
jgi:hypothetical protein